MLPAFLLEAPPPPEYAAYLQHLPANSRLFAALYVPAFLFAPAFLWAFARECPGSIAGPGSMIWRAAWSRLAC